MKPRCVETTEAAGVETKFLRKKLPLTNLPEHNYISTPSLGGVFFLDLTTFILKERPPFSLLRDQCSFKEVRGAEEVMKLLVDLLTVRGRPEPPGTAFPGDGEPAASGPRPPPPELHLVS